MCGVCGGLGDYFEVDPVLVRIICVMMAFASGFGLLAYIVAWIIIPKREFGQARASTTTESEEISPKPYSPWSRYLPGIILIGIGTLLLVRENWYWFDWEEFWPALLIVVGLTLIFRKFKHSDAEEPLAAHGGTSSQADNNMNHNGGTV
ncbi:MAG: PspC domain-containing protein [bacterium]|nr:PspC domain-containing protein [bacterium]